jgi:hypothetical protein
MFDPLDAFRRDTDERPVTVAGGVERTTPGRSTLAVPDRHWDAALRADRAGDHVLCLHHCLLVLMARPHDREARLLGAGAAHGARDWRRAAALLGDLVDDGEEPPGHLDWKRILAATITGDDEGVRRSAERLGLDTGAWSETDSRTDPAAWRDPDALLLVELDGVTLVTRRTGPATARIVSIAPVGEPQHLDDVVVFDPTPTAGRALPDDPGGPERHQAVLVLERGSATVFTVRGVDPGEEAWAALTEALNARGWRWRRSYGLTGALAAVAVPPSSTRSDALVELEQLTARWPRPIAWRF